jgi:hypothetical protein
LQGVDLSWCTGLASAMPLLSAGLRKSTSLFRFHVADCASYALPPSDVPPSVAPTTEETARCVSWMQEMERYGDRNYCLFFIRAPNERLPHRGV